MARPTKSKTKHGKSSKDSDVQQQPAAKKSRGGRADRVAALVQDHEGDINPLVDPALQSHYSVDTLKSPPRQESSIPKTSGRAKTAQMVVQARGDENTALPSVTEDGLPYYSPYANTPQHEEIAETNMPDEPASSAAADDVYVANAGVPDDADRIMLDELNRVLARNNSADARARIKPPTAPKTRIKKVKPVKKASLTKKAPPPPKPVIGERFSPDEILELDAYKARWCLEKRRPQEDFNNLIQENIRENKLTFAIYKDLEETFPNHRHAYIQRYCRRKYHNFTVRGTWTPEADQDLRDAVEQYGTSWKKIGTAIGRFHEDCRDRWRNYLIQGENRVREQWTEVEILNLAVSIIKSVKMTRDERRKKLAEKQEWPTSPKVDEEAEDYDPMDPALVNWLQVSAGMGKHGQSRSRLQCSFKWNRMKDTQQAEYTALALDSLDRDGELDNEAMLDALDEHPSSTTTKTSEWRGKIAQRKVKHMLAGDKNDLLQAILHSGAPVEGNIPWQALGDDPKVRKWTTAERKAAWVMLKADLEPGVLAKAKQYQDIIHALLPGILAQDINAHWDPSGYAKILEEEREAAKAEKERVAAEKEREEYTWPGLDPALMNNDILAPVAPLASMVATSHVQHNEHPVDSRSIPQPLSAEEARIQSTAQTDGQDKELTVAPADDLHNADQSQDQGENENITSGKQTIVRQSVKAKARKKK